MCVATETKAVLLLGCGHARKRRIRSADEPEEFGDEVELTTVDINPDCGADIVRDIEKLPLPFVDEAFDECHSYDTIEHFGQQGDWRAWFDWISEVHRILKPGGTLSVIVPTGNAAFSDPGHTRFFHPNHFGFLTKGFFERNRDDGRPATDYTWYIKRWWTIDYLEEKGDALAVVMRKA